MSEYQSEESEEASGNTVVDALGGFDNARQILSAFLKAEKEVTVEGKRIAVLASSIFENSLEYISTDSVLSAFDEKFKTIAMMKAKVKVLKAKYEELADSSEQGAKFKKEFLAIIDNLDLKVDKLHRTILTMRFQFEQIMPTIEAIRNRCSDLLQVQDFQVEELVMGPLNQNGK